MRRVAIRLRGLENVWARNRDAISTRTLLIDLMLRVGQRGWTSGLVCYSSLGCPVTQPTSKPDRHISTGVIEFAHWNEL